jgi:hypothetical protein
VLPSLQSGELHVRWYMFVPALPAAVHITPVHLVESITPFSGVVLGIEDNGIEVNLSESGTTVGSTRAVPRDRWACFQVQIVISDTAGSVTASVDGVVHATRSGIDTSPVAAQRLSQHPCGSVRDCSLRRHHRRLDRRDGREHDSDLV